MTLTRRSLIGGLFCAAAAPAIVRISSLMPVKAMWIPGTELPDYCGLTLTQTNLQWSVSEVWQIKMLRQATAICPSYVRAA
jgi:hypothetical protein